jgi:hypothetical protein
MKVLKVPVLLFLLPVLFSCATAPFNHIESAVEKGQYEEGVRLIEEGKKKLYRNQDAVLYYLDKGLVAHYAGLYEDSSALLESGERAIEEAYTKSVSAAAASYLVNDTVLEYDGEDYEDIYINTFNALNYYHRGDMEEAMVEIRRMNNKVQFLASKYGIIMSGLQKKALEDNSALPENTGGSSEFSDSALARYMGVLFHRAAGREDDALIDYNYLKVAFANSPDVYRYPVPASVDGELSVPEGMARLNIIAWSGLSPVKNEETLRIPISESNYIKIALPVLSYRSSQVNSIEVMMDGGDVFSLELLEDIGAVAGETFKNKKNVIYLKTIIRATAKGITSTAFDSAANESEGNTSLVFSILSLGNKIFSEASERADLRISRFFPARAWVGGLNLPPGVYSFTVNYLDSQGKVIASFREEDIDVRENKLNLKEEICLK